MLVVDGVMGMGQKHFDEDWYGVPFGNSKALRYKVPCAVIITN